MKREANQMWVVKAPDGRVYYDEARKFRTVALAVFVVSRGRQVKWRWYLQPEVALREGIRLHGDARGLQ